MEQQPTWFRPVSDTLPEARPLRLVQISDSHLGATVDFRLAGVRPWHSLQEVIARLAELSVLDHIMVTGDIAADGEDAAYGLFAQAMSSLKRPYSWLPGNHDDFAAMQVHPRLPPFQPLIALGNWRLLCLNTTVPGAVGGFVDHHQLAALEAALDALTEHPIALFMHHPPASIGCRWLDRQRVANGEALAAILRRQRTVKALFSGHVHQGSQVDFAGIPLFTAPATSVQFEPGSEQFALAPSPPAFRRIDLHDDGQVTTGIITLDNSSERADLAAGGY